MHRLSESELHFLAYERSGLCGGFQRGRIYQKRTGNDLDPSRSEQRTE